MEVQTAKAGGAITYKYDAFVSYCSSDEEWSRAELIDPMMQRGLQIFHKGEFIPGTDKVDERARAVEESRRTIIVVTPEWCNSQADAFDAVLAQTADLSAAGKRLIPLLLRPCTLPLRLDKLVPADFTNPQRHKEAMAFLLRNLGANEAAVGSAKKGIAALAELMRIPAVQTAVSGCDKSFEEATDRITVMARNKRLHDYFQKAESAFKLLLKERQQLKERQKVATKGNPREVLDEAASNLRVELESLLDFARSDDFPKDELYWVDRVDRANGELAQAILNKDDDALARVCIRLLKELAGVPGQLNRRLKEAAKALGLAEVAEKLRAALSALAAGSFDKEAQARLTEFSNGIVSLDRLDGSLRTLIDNHNTFQEIDDLERSFDANLLRSADERPNLEALVAEIADVWPDLRRPLGDLSGEGGVSWLAGLREVETRLSPLLGRRQSEPQAMREIETLFQEFRDKIYKAFNRTDEDLRRFCDQLQRVGQTLTKVIGRMKQHV